jgi:hypothetical protein
MAPKTADDWKKEKELSDGERHALAVSMKALSRGSRI